MKHHSCCFSGHRNLPIEQTLHINNLLVNEIFKLINKGVSNFICGGALGFDTMAAQTILKARIIYPHIQLTMALPSPQQTNRWLPYQGLGIGKVYTEPDKIYKGLITKPLGLFKHLH